MLIIKERKRTGTRTGKPQVNIQWIENGKIVKSKNFNPDKITYQNIADFVNQPHPHFKPKFYGIQTVEDYLL